MQPTNIHDNTLTYRGTGFGNRPGSIVVRSDLKSTSQCNKAAAAARRIIAMVRRNFSKLDKEDFLLVYKVYIRPRLEFSIQS